jgi:hypothetical protein
MGCGSGKLCALYKRINPMALYAGIRCDEKRAQVASEQLDRVAIGDAETLELAALGLAPAQMACIVYRGALEEMRDPWSALIRHAQWLSERGLGVFRPEFLVPRHPLWQPPHAVVTPHVASHHSGRLARIERSFEVQVAPCLASIPPQKAVNLKTALSDPEFVEP